MTFLDVGGCGLGIHRLRVGDRYGHFLLKDNLIGEEGDPVLEVRHDTVSSTPSSFTIRLA